MTRLREELKQTYEDFFGDTLKKVDKVLKEEKGKKENINYKKEIEKMNLNQTFNKWFGDLL